MTATRMSHPPRARRLFVQRIERARRRPDDTHRSGSSVAHQPTDFGVVTQRIMSRELHGATPGGPIGHAGCSRKARRRRRERRAARAQGLRKAALISRLVLALRTWFCNRIARAAAARSLTMGVGIRIGQIDQHGHTNCSGHQLAQEASSAAARAPRAAMQPPRRRAA